jgi:hypothetical protein
LRLEEGSRAEIPGNRGRVIHAALRSSFDIDKIARCNGGLAQDLNDGVMGYKSGLQLIVKVDLKPFHNERPLRVLLPLGKEQLVSSVDCRLGSLGRHREF